LKSSTAMAAPRVRGGDVLHGRALADVLVARLVDASHPPAADDAHDSIAPHPRANSRIHHGVADVTHDVRETLSPRSTLRQMHVVPVRRAVFTPSRRGTMRTTEEKPVENARTRPPSLALWLTFHGGT